MKYRSCILALIFTVTAPCATSVNDTPRLLAVEFDKYWNRYARSLFGCPEFGEMTPDTCHDYAATVDADSLYRAAQIFEKIHPRVKQ